MFTQLKRGRWNYMFLAAVTSLAVAALVTLFSNRNETEKSNHASHNSEQTITGRYTQYNETTVRFIN